MSIDSKLDSNEYQCKLSEHLTSLLIKTKSAENEAQTSQAFQNEIYYFVRNFFEIEPDFRPEESQKTLRHKFTGRMDAVCNSLVIEYKKPGKLESDKDKNSATAQISNYLTQLRQKDSNEYSGVLTDGIKIRYVYFQDGKINTSPFKNIDVQDLDNLVRSIINVNNKKFLPKNIVHDFRLDSPSQVTLNLAKYLFEKIKLDSSEKTSMLYQEWKVLFHLSESDKGQNEDISKRRKALSHIFDFKIDGAQSDYQALFALQTTYAIIVKLIACKVITKLQFKGDIDYFSDLSDIDSETLREFLQYIEDGYVFQTGGVRNLLEGDFFSWYCSSDIWSDEESSLIVQLINSLESYSNSFFSHGYNTVDIFIDLYMEIMPAEVRHSLGEYFTPAWLADYVVKESANLAENPNFTAIDPCCGSGVFIMALIKQIVGNTDIQSLSSKEKKELLNNILTRVKGVDINPLSVLTAKVSFYLSIRPLIDDDDIEIPVFLGDSANIPTTLFIDEVECYHYEVNTIQETIKVTLPKVFVESEDFFSSMSEVQSFVKAESAKLVFDKIVSNIPANYINEKIKSDISLLATQLIELHKKNWDGIWIRIVANFMLVGRVNNIDLVIGNPPWVKWEFLPQIYANKLKSICLDRHLFSGQTYMGAISLNICALIANVTASSWLNKNGVLAFLMPQTLMTQDSYAGFRDFYTDFDNDQRMYLQKLDDWTNSGNPFIDTNEKFMTYYYKNNFVDYFKNGIPIDVLKKKRGVSVLDLNSKQSFEEVSDSFEFSTKRAFQMDIERTGYTTLDFSDVSLKAKFDKIIGECDYKARSGVEFTPAETYFIEPECKVTKKNSYSFKTSKFKNSKYKSKTNLPIQLETTFIRPVIKAPDIIPFGFNVNNHYCIFPYEDNISVCIGDTELSKKSPSLFTYLTNSKALIGKQSKRSKAISRGSDFYALSKVGPYTYAPNKVTFRDNTKLSAAVVQDIKTPWGDVVTPICAKHSPYISQDKEGRNITEDEAYYLCGILNTPVVKQYFKTTYSTRSFSINFNIKMPLYEETNEHQVKIMGLARQATLKGVTDELLKELEESYLALCS
jgi:hypothetical protein